MSDIFISYSRKDSEQALSLAERLRGEGMSVWIDQQGIEAAKTWSEEIVNAIEASKAFVVLLSSSSIESDNVARELSLAFESKRPLIPVALEDVTLPARFKYQLAGIQRVAFTQSEAITSALLSFGVVSRATTVDTRKSLLVMPFEDLSPTQDNRWFADGLAGELIDKLAQVRSLRVIDRKTSRDLRESKLSVYQIAGSLKVEFVIEGSVRKFDDELRISVALMNISKGEYLWQGSHKGTMADVFDLQEKVANALVSGLSLHLDQGERKAVGNNITSSVQAYELFLRAREITETASASSAFQALELYLKAIDYDPSFTRALTSVATCHLDIYRLYERDPSRVLLAESFAERVYALEGNTALANWLKARICHAKGDLIGAENFARLSMMIDPKYTPAYNVLGVTLRERKDFPSAIQVFEEAMRLLPSPKMAFDGIVILESAKMFDRLAEWCKNTFALVQTHYHLYPENPYTAMQYAITAWWAGKSDITKQIADKLDADPSITGIPLFNLACVFEYLKEYDRTVQVLRRLVDQGYSHYESFLSFGPPVSEIPEFQSLLETLRIRNQEKLKRV